MSLPTDSVGHTFEGLYQDWWETVRSTAMTILGADDAAQDVAQRVFLRLWHSGAWRRIDCPREFFRRAAVNGAVSAGRRTRRRYELLRELARLPASFGLSPENELLRKEQFEALERLIETLPPRCGLVCSLVFLGELTHLEAARVLGITPKAVEKQVARARRLLGNAGGVDAS